jgi:hypothetical protein
MGTSLDQGASAVLLFFLIIVGHRAQINRKPIDLSLQISLEIQFCFLGEFGWYCMKEKMR